jgi:prevent-host-death family protein
MEQIGVRELRQHASRYLDRVAHGETLEVTDRGRPVARLVPITSDRWADMIASGRVTPAERGGDITDEMPADFDVDASAVLEAMRADER